MSRVYREGNLLTCHDCGWKASLARLRKNQSTCARTAAPGARDAGVSAACLSEKPGQNARGFASSGANARTVLAREKDGTRRDRAGN